MKESKIFLDYIEKIKKVIDKIKKIEYIFDKIKMEELNGGGNNNKNKLEKYKQEILKLREIRNKYLMELEMYKEKIKTLTIQNQYFYKKISELSFVNYINYTEKNNLVDKLDFFNKSLDTLQSSILTNVNAGNELLERFNTKTKMNGENKISNVNITITNKDLEGDGFKKIVSVGGKDNELEQTGGYEIGKFKRENKISKVTAELQNKITLMRTITQGVRRIIENIIRNINDQNNNNSLLNIRIKLEWIMNKFRELSEDNEEAKALLNVLGDVKAGLDNNITDMNVFETLLDKINKDTKSFVEDAGEITKDLPVNAIVESRANYNKIQTGGYDNEIEIDNLIKLINIYQRGGADNDRQYYDFNTITKWLDFFANCRSWPETLKYKFNIIRTNYYMSKKVLEQIKKSFIFGDEKTNPINLLMPIIEKNTFDYNIISNENISEVFKDDFDSNNSSNGIKEKTEEIKKELPIDLDSLMLAFLLENNSDNAESDKLEKYEKYFINMNNNLTELLYSLNFFKALSFAFKLIDPSEKGVEIDDIEQNETTKIFTSLQKLVYQTELFKDPSEFITLKSELLQNAFTKLYWKPFEKFLSIYNSLDDKLQADIDILDDNIRNFILGMKYSSNQSQIHSMFYNIDLNNKNSSSVNITDYDTTFLYINMLKRALYIKENKDFKTIFDAIINANSKNLELKIKKTDIINFSKLPDDNIPELVEENKKLTGGARKLIGGDVPELILTPDEAKAKLIENAKLAFNNVNRSKVTDMYSMIDKVVDGLKLETFSKIKTYITNLDAQIVTKDKSGAFTGKSLESASIVDNINNTIKGKKELDIEKEKLRLILENIAKDQGRNIIKGYKDAINDKLNFVDEEISKLESNFETQKNDVNKLMQQITELYTKISSSSDLATINNLTAQKKTLAKTFKQQFKTYYSSSKNKIKFINDKGYLLDFIEFVNGQEKIYNDTQVSNSNSQEIIKILGELDTSNNEKFNNSKSQIKDKIRDLIKTSDNEKDYLEKYELLKKLNIQLIYSVDKIVTESLNAVTVFVKARKEGNTESDRYSYDKTCITVKEKEGPPKKFGQFKNIFWSNRTISDLYCGKDINCNEKVPLTNSVRDMIQIGTKSVVIFTYGPSGSGKTKILTGIPYGNVEGDKRGVITRIMEDSLDNITISSSGTEISIEVMVGEIYGEKANLSLLDNKYIECLFIWDLATLEERLYTSDISQEAPNEYNQFTDKIQFLEDLKGSQYTSDDRKFNISLLDKIKIWRSTHQMKNKFNPDPNYLKKFLNLEGYTKNPTELAEYNNIYKIAGLSNDDESTLYTKFTDEDSFKKFSKKISDPKDISKFGQEVSMELEDKIDKIQAIRRVKNRVRCTKYNPDSSRSHMYIIIRIIDPVTGQYKYYIIIDKAGSEIPYEIAASEFVRLAPDLNEDEISFFTVNYLINIEENPGQDEKQDLMNLKKKLDTKKLTDLQKIVKGDFINKTSISYKDNTNPIIELFFSENFIIKIETKINDVSKRISENITRGDNTRNLIKIKELSLSLNIKIIISGVSQDFNYVMNHEIDKPLNIDLSLLMKILREQKKTDESIIREIIANIQSSKIKKNMPLLLFSGNTGSNTNIFELATDNINTSISNLTNNLMDMLNLLNKGTSISTNTKLDSAFKNDFEKFYREVEPQFLNYKLSNLTTLPEIPKVGINITKSEFIVINTVNKNNFKNDLNENINNINSYLLKLQKVNKVNLDKIQLLINSIQGFTPSSASSTINLDTLDDLTPENYDNILDAIQKGIEIIKKAYLFINLDNKIEAHKIEDRTKLISNFNAQTTDIDKKKLKFTYESDFIKSLFEQVIEKSFTSSVDRTLPTTKQLNIDHRSLLASYFIQRAYFSKLKQGLIGCNSQVIIDVTTKITDTIRFIFDSVENNPITKSFINTNYVTTVDAEFRISEEMDKNKLFEKDEKIKRDIGKWMNKAITSGTKPETLQDLSKILDALKINYKHLNSIDEIKLIRNNNDKITFYIKRNSMTETTPTDEEIKTSVRNLIKQLYLISKLDDVLRFLNFIENTSTKIIDLRSNTSIIANFDEILWKDNDKITYMIEYERLFNITSLFALDENSIKFKELNQAKDQWTNNDRKDYGKIWENVANNIIPIYLLNVRQGFWINHSIRTLMRNIMYTSDNVWLDNPIFDVDEATKNESLGSLDPAKKSTAALLLENIYTLEDYLIKYKYDKENISNRIFSNRDTLEQVYLADYDISTSPWLKLLGTIYHLGADNHPTDINIKLVKGAKSISKGKWGGTKLKENFVTLNLSLFKNKELAEQFIEMIAIDPEYPEAFDFSEKMFIDITSQKNPGAYLNREDDVKKLRLPWNVLKLTPGETEKIKRFFNADSEFQNLFKYTIDDDEITFEEIDKLNKIYEENNKLLIAINEPKEKIEKFVIKQIREYKEKVNKFTEDIAAMRIQDAMKQFNFNLIQLGGGFINQIGGADYSEEEKNKLGKYLQDSKELFPNKTNTDIIAEVKTNSTDPKIGKYDDKQLIMLGRKDKDDAPFTKIIVEFVTPILKNLDQTEKINYLFSQLKTGIIESSVDKYYAILNAWSKLSGAIDTLIASIGYFDGAERKVWNRTDRKLESTTLSGNTKICEEILNIKRDIMALTKFNNPDIEKFININNLISSIELICKFFTDLFSGNISEIKTYPQVIQMQEDIAFVLSIKKKIFDEINSPDINHKIFQLYITNYTQELEKIKNKINTAKSKDIQTSIRDNDRKNIITEIDKLIENNNKLASYSNKSGSDKENNNEIIRLKYCEYILLKLKLNQDYLQKINASITINPDDPIKTFNNINTYISIINEINEQNIIFREELNNLIPDLVETNQKKINEELNLIPDNFTAIDANIKKYKEETDKLNTQNATLVKDLKKKFAKEIKVKGQLDISYPVRNEYYSAYESYLDSINEKMGKSKENKQNFILTLNSLADGLKGEPKSIDIIKIPSNNKKENSTQVSDIIITQIQEYINKNGIYPDSLDSSAFDELINSIYEEIKNLIFNTIKPSKKELIKKIELGEKPAIFNEIIRQRELIDYSSGDVLSDNTKKYLDIQDSDDEQEKTKKINKAKNDFYNIYFKDPNAGMFRNVGNALGVQKITGAYLFKDDEIKQLDKLITMLSNLLFIEDFGYIRDVNGDIIYEKYYIIDDKTPKADKTAVTKLIKNILNTNKYKRENKIEDPLAGKNLDNVTIPELKASKQIQSLNSTVKKFNISKSVILLLALSTSEYKVGLCTVALKFASLLTQITNPPCPDEEKVQGGGRNIKKKYKLLKTNDKIIYI